MKKLLTIFCSFLFLVSCSQSGKETYPIPNYFKHHENGDVKQITIQTFEVNNGAFTPYPDNYVAIWGESANGTTTYDKNGNILSDNFYEYEYDENGRLIRSYTKEGNRTSTDFIYDELDEIHKWGDKTFRYNDNNQICAVIEVYEPHGVYLGSYREYEYNDDGQMKSCNFNHNKSIYGSEYNQSGELQRHVQLMEQGRVQEFQITVTKRDDKNNWTERRITGTYYNGRPVEYLQKREIRYY